MALYQVNVIATLANTKQMRWHFDLETPVTLTGTELQDIVDTAKAPWVNAATLALYGTDMSLGNLEIFQFERLDNCPGSAANVFTCPDGKVRYVRKPLTPKTTSAGGPSAGLAATNSLPPQNAVVVSFRTALAGRRFFGRAYTPPPPEGVATGDGLITDAVARKDRVEAVIAAAEGAIAPVDVDHVVYSIRYNEQAEVTSYVAGARVDTQRRRRTRGA